MKIGNDSSRHVLRLPITRLAVEDGGELGEHETLTLGVVVLTMDRPGLLEQRRGSREVALVVGHDRQIAKGLTDQPRLVRGPGPRQRLFEHLAGRGVVAVPSQSLPPPGAGFDLGVSEAGVASQLDSLACQLRLGRRSRCR